MTKLGDNQRMESSLYLIHEEKVDMLKNVKEIFLAGAKADYLHFFLDSFFSGFIFRSPFPSFFIWDGGHNVVKLLYFKLYKTIVEA